MKKLLILSLICLTVFTYSSEENKDPKYKNVAGAGQLGSIALLCTYFASNLKANDYDTLYAIKYDFKEMPRWVRFFNRPSILIGAFVGFYTFSQIGDIASDKLYLAQLKKKPLATSDED